MKISEHLYQLYMKYSDEVLDSFNACIIDKAEMERRMGWLVGMDEFLRGRADEMGVLHSVTDDWEEEDE